MPRAYATPASADHAGTLRVLARFCSEYARTRGVDGPLVTPIEGLTIIRSTHETTTNHTLLRPALCIVAQGAKWTTLGRKRFNYRAGDALVVSAEMPTTGRIVEASEEEPYIAVVVEFDLAILREVVAAMPQQPPAGRDGLSLFVTKIDGSLADAVLRLVRLLETPEAIPVLYPAVMREIAYWLLSGSHGGEIARLALSTEHIPHVITAIRELRDRFAEPIRIEELASVAQMSPSTFHRQFKAVTQMTPLQYQKKLRLLEARRLMTSDAANVETAAFQVGYESTSQFSREYARMFGTSPGRDARTMRG